MATTEWTQGRASNVADHIVHADATARLPGDTPVEIQFDCRGDRLVRLGFTNGLLRVLTLGIYSSWAKTNVRQRIWSFTKLNGEPTQYTGTGRELFSGLMVVAAIFFLPALIGSIALALLFPERDDVQSTYQIAIAGIIFFLLGNARYRALRYRMSRTTWRGIRGALVGSPERYGWVSFWTLALPVLIVSVLAAGAAAVSAPNVGAALLVVSAIILPWVLPWRANHLRGLLTRDMRFGDQPFTYDGSSGPLYQRFLLAWVGGVVVVATFVGGSAITLVNSGLLGAFTAPAIVPLPLFVVALQLIGLAIVSAALLGLLTAAYRAAVTRHFASHTHFGDATFGSAVTGSGVAWLAISNWALWGIAALAGLGIGLLLLNGAGLGSAITVPGADTGEANNPMQPLALLVMLFPVIILVTAATTVAEFRSAKYYTSRLRLDGVVDVNRIMQSDSVQPKRGEGLAHMLDVDAF